MPAIRRSPLHAPPIPLPLNHLRHIAGDLSDQQAHRHVGEGEADGERHGESENDDDECCES